MYNASKFDTVLTVMKVIVIKVTMIKATKLEIFLDNIGISKQG